MRRLYFVLPDMKTAHTVVDELLLKRIASNHIHVMAKDDADLEDLPEATLFQKSDFIPALERGLAIGGVTGALAGIVAVTFFEAASALGAGAVILGTTLTGAIVGTWVSGMIGVDVRNTQIEKFETAIENGELLLMVDVPKDQANDVEKMVHGHHPQAEKGGTEPHIPAFP